MSKQNAVMNKEFLSDAITVYTFVDPAAKHSDSITVISQDNQALFLDTGYPEYAEQVKKDLATQGIQPKIVVLSHYHPDHVAGCAAIANCTIYASKFYESNYGNCRIWEPNYIYIRPQQFLQNGQTLAFGNVTLNFIYTPGHSKCHMTTKINENIVHGGDLVMITKDNKTTLPLIGDGGNFNEHIKSLQTLKQLTPDILILPHGGAIRGIEKINELIDERLFYLQKVQQSKGVLSLSTCLKKPITNYDYLEFHNINLVRLF